MSCSLVNFTFAQILQIIDVLKMAVYDRPLNNYYKFGKSFALSPAVSDLSLFAIPLASCQAASGYVGW